MSGNKYLDKSINQMGLDDKLINILNKNNINFVKDIWNLRRKDLKSCGMSDTQINEIIIHLQLNGLDLNKKVYNKM